MGETKKEKKKIKGKVSVLVELLVLAIAPLAVLAIIIAVVSANDMKKSMQELTKNGLNAQAYNLLELYEATDSGDYYEAASTGDIYKGMTRISKKFEILDTLKEDTGYDLTLFYGDTRVVTTLIDEKTGERMIGTQASEKVVDAVLNKGETYYDTGVVINGHPYYGYYIPVRNSDESIVGLAFAGVPSKQITDMISSSVRSIVIVAVVVLIIASIFVAVFARTIASAIAGLNSVVAVLADGNLNVEVPEKVKKRSDEIGQMAVGIDNLATKLKEIITNIKNSSAVLLNSGNSLDEMASQTSNTTDEISRAIEDISKGAVSQAEEIETASIQIGNMGNVIEDIVVSVDELGKASTDMKNASDESTIIIDELSKSNDRTTDAIKRIDEQVHATNDSVQTIRQAVELITAIADETSLLSLNASIEAARAGENGRGFAVVASEIQKLAEQSNSSAKHIQDIIDQLLAKSETTVKVMEEVELIIAQQQKKLDETKEKFSKVTSGVNSSREDTQAIQGHTEVCDSSRAKVVDVIQNLSAISEENAASTQETTASMQELNATINLLAEAARNLKDLSVDLDNDMQFFKL